MFCLSFSLPQLLRGHQKVSCPSSLHRRCGWRGRPTCLSSWKSASWQPPPSSSSSSSSPGWVHTCWPTSQFKNRGLMKPKNDWFSVPHRSSIWLFYNTTDLMWRVVFVFFCSKQGTVVIICLGGKKKSKWFVRGASKNIVVKTERLWERHTHLLRLWPTQH